MAAAPFSWADDDDEVDSLPPLPQQTVVTPTTTAAAIARPSYAAISSTPVVVADLPPAPAVVAFTTVRIKPKTVMIKQKTFTTVSPPHQQKPAVLVPICGSACRPPASAQDQEAFFFLCCDNPRLRQVP